MIFSVNKQVKILTKLFLVLFLLVTAFFVRSQNAEASPMMQDGPTYIVQQGDTLNTIALRFGVSAEEIQSINNLSDPNALNIGQRLVIPGLPGISGVLTSTTLPFGTTLTKLSRQYQSNLADLAVLNKITSPSESMAGLRFIIPVKEDQDPFQPVGLIATGGTLLETAIRAGRSPWILTQHNQLQSSWAVMPGETLFSMIDPDSPETTNTPSLQITLIDLPVIQGETLQIAINSTTNAAFSGFFDNQPLNFFSDDDENFYSFMGIHALAEPKPYPLSITATYPDGSSQTMEQLVLLAEGGYGNEWVNVPEGYLDEEAIAEEDAYLETILTQTSPERFWDGLFRYPVDEPCLNSLFGQRRDYNNGGLYFYHTGIDFAVCAQNLNVYAPAAGKIVVAEELFVKGKAIVIDHGWGVFSGYWHLSEFNANVGDFVQPGDIIGQIGNTGRSAGPHLHFEIDITGTPVNPLTWLEQEFPQPAQ